MRAASARDAWLGVAGEVEQEPGNEPVAREHHDRIQHVALESPALHEVVGEHPCKDDALDQGRGDEHPVVVHGELGVEQHAQVRHHHAGLLDEEREEDVDRQGREEVTREERVLDLVLDLAAPVLVEKTDEGGEDVRDRGDEEREVEGRVRAEGVGDHLRDGDEPVEVDVDHDGDSEYRDGSVLELGLSLFAVVEDGIHEPVPLEDVVEVEVEAVEVPLGAEAGQQPDGEQLEHGHESP